MPLNLDDNDLNEIIGEVGRDLETIVSNTAQRLSKADDKSPPEKSPAEASPEASASSSSGGDSGPPSDGGDSGGPPADASASAPPDASASAPPADPSASAGGDPAAQGEDLETKLQALPDDQLRHLYMACKQAMFARMASADPQASASAPGAPPAAPPPAPAASASPSAPPPPAASASPAAPPMAPPAGPPMPPPAMKGEMKASPANGGGKTTAVKVGKNEPAQGQPLAKSEQVPAEVQAKLDEQGKMIEGLMKAVNILGAPLRKAVTQISQVQHMAKPGSAPEQKPAASNLSKSEITEKLKGLDLRKTTPKDREAVNGFYCGRYGVEKIAHLLG